MQKVLNHTIICSLFICLLVANIHAGEWVPSKSLDRVAGAEQVMVKTERMDEEVMELIYSVPVPEIILSDNGTDDYKDVIEKILLGNAPSRGEPGKPVLPVIPVRLVLPPGRDLGNLEIVTGTKIVLPGKHVIEHGQRPYPLLPEVVAESKA